ncbi:MAG: hypothetical protein A2Y75_05230 [Candidatus Solincola sediminis]|uniref:DUF669 domain-containing protein n=1 Tax=Candidatus Solincola sediminis TaxID=1797199 RepID=A0A1F2WG35_9ACTN|nr:MAG: hypothetical protein A2Y75_05230 [Candidatus Solincola sediminis]
MTSIDWASLRQTADDATKPVPEGEYDLVVNKAEATRASSGSPMIKMQLRVVGGPSDKKTIFHNITLTADNAFALAMFFRAMDAFGLNSTWFEQNNPSLEQIAAGLVERPVHATIGIRQFQGSDRNEIKQLSTSLTGGVGVPLAVTTTNGPGVPSVPTPGSTSPATPTTPMVPSIPQPSIPQPNVSTGAGVPTPPGLPI